MKICFEENEKGVVLSLALSLQTLILKPFSVTLVTIKAVQLLVGGHRLTLLLK